MQAQANTSSVHLLFIRLYEAIQLEKLRLLLLINARSVVGYTYLQHLLRHYIVNGQMLELRHETLIVARWHYFYLNPDQTVLRSKLASI
jgi:hypothetical protein